MDRRNFVGALLAGLAGVPPAAIAQTGRDKSPTALIVVPAGFSRGPDGALHSAGDEDWHFLIRTGDSDGRFSIFWNDTPPGMGPRLHVHHDVDEWFYVVSGEMVLEVGGKLRRLKAGDSALGPQLVPHRYGNPGPVASRMLILCAPGGHIEEFFEALASRRAAGHLSQEEYAKLWEQYHMTLLGDRLTMEEMRHAV